MPFVCAVKIKVIFTLLQGFIPEIVGASKTNESLAANNMQILKLLSEEVFDFSKGNLTQAKVRELKQQFNSEFSLIFELCQVIFIAVSLYRFLSFSLN